MSHELISILSSSALLLGMIGMTVAGHRYGRRQVAGDPEGATGTGAVDAAVFSLFGLLLAFSFSGAYSRFDGRRQLVVKEVNAIGTAYLRLDLLSDAERDPLRGLMREYVESRRALWDKLLDRPAAEAELKHSLDLQSRIWTRAVEATSRPEEVAAQRLLLPALNEMIDVTTTRYIAITTHSPLVIYLTLDGLALISAFLVGFGMARNRKLHWLHIVAFAVIATFIVYLILDIDYPRDGLMRLDAVHDLFLDLAESMR